MAIGLIPKSGTTVPETNETEEITSSLARKTLISKECIEALQLRQFEEEKSSRLYEDMSLYLNNAGYTNASKLWHKYGAEEMDHANWAREYLMSLGIQPKLKDMPSLPGKYGCLCSVIRMSYKHEIEITEQCNDLAKCAVEAGDHMLHDLAHKYLREQVEEVDKMQTWMDKIDLFGDDKVAMRFLEMEIGELLED